MRTLTPAGESPPPRPKHLAELPGSAMAGDIASTVQSESLLRGQKSVTIQHNGSVYRLQATKLGKLILTK